jgi:hypothetical protein
MYSYGYDGARVLKWNEYSRSYGERWFIGDIIGVALNLDDCYIEFFKNGRSLSKAFDIPADSRKNLWFPSMSLAKNEKLGLMKKCNFCPEGYKSLVNHRGIEIEPYFTFDRPAALLKPTVFNNVYSMSLFFNAFTFANNAPKVQI